MNCGSDFDTPYCGQCGQEATSGKVTFAEMRRTALRAFSLERGWLHTVVDLTLRPVAMIRAYLDGKRIAYIGPVRYAITLNSLYMVFAVLLGPEALGLDKLEGGAKFQATFTDFLQRYWAPLMLLSAPAFAATSWFIFRPRRLSFPEHLTLNLFNLGHASILSAIATLFSVLFPHHFITIWNISLFAGFAYYAWLIRGVCASNAWTAIGGALLVQSLGMIAVTILGILGLALYLLARWYIAGEAPV